MALLPATQTDGLGKSWTFNQSLCDTIAGLKSIELRNEMMNWIPLEWGIPAVSKQKRKKACSENGESLCVDGQQTESL